MIWYWSGVFVVLCIGAVILCCMGRDRGKVILISESDNIVIWRSNKKE